MISSMFALSLAAKFHREAAAEANYLRPSFSDQNEIGTEFEFGFGNVAENTFRKVTPAKYVEIALPISNFEKFYSRVNTPILGTYKIAFDFLYSSISESIQFHWSHKTFFKWDGEIPLEEKEKDAAGPKTRSARFGFVLKATASNDLGTGKGRTGWKDGTG